MVILWDIGDQHSPRCEAAERGIPSGAILFAHRNFMEKSDKKKIKITTKNESGLIQLIMMGESIRQIWVKVDLSLFGICQTWFLTVRLFCTWMSYCFTGYALKTWSCMCVYIADMEK